MLIDFTSLPEISIPHLNDGQGAVSARMFTQPNVKIMISRIPTGSSIGIHLHSTSCELNYVLSGTGFAFCDGAKEVLRPGTCQYCPKGSSHSFVNDGEADLVLFTVVPEQ